MKITHTLVRKAAALALGVGMLGSAFAPLTASAVSPANYYITATSSVTGSTVSINGAASANHFTGQSTDQQIAISWDNGATWQTLVGSGGLNFTDSSNNGIIATTTFATSTTYTTAGSYTIRVGIFHAQPSGQEGGTNTVTFNVVIPPSSHTITASADANSTISPSGAVSVTDGGTQAFTFSAGVGFILHLFVDGVANSSTSPYTFSNVTADHTISVTASSTAPTTHTITATAGANGTISPSGSVTVSDGADQSFTFTPSGGFQVASITIDGGASEATTTTSYTFSGVTADHSIDVEFAAIPPTIADLSVAKTANTSTPAPGDTVYYDIVVSNAGPANATNVAITDTLPAGLAFADASSTQGTYDSGTHVWTVGTVNSSSSATLHLAATVGTGHAGDTIINSASITASDQSDNNPDNNTGTASVTVTCPSGEHANADKICISNNGTLTVKKVVIGGPSAGHPEDFAFSINGGESTTTFNANGENDLTVDPGTYTVTEPQTADYTTAYDNCTNVDVAAGQTATCTITNTYNPAVLTIVKDTNGGDGTFTFSVGGQQDGISIDTVEGTGSQDTTLSDGTYDVTENVPLGWTLDSIACHYDNQSIGNTIPNGEQIVVEAGDHVTCTFTNTKQVVGPGTGTLVVKKVVVGSSESPADFSFSTDGGETTTAFNANGENDLTLTAGAYTVAETATSSFTTTYSGDCDSSGHVTVPQDGTATCTVTNTAVAAAPTTVITQCNDGIDNDHDGRIDSADPECHTDGVAGNPRSYDPSINDESHHGGGGGGGGGRVLGASTTGQVLGASCGVYLDKHLRRGSLKNDVDQTKKVQTFLNKWMSANLPITGFFGPLTEAAVKAFQAKYSDSILKPWGISSPTGLVYLTTLYQINLLECPSLTAELPPLVNWSQNPTAQ